MFCLLKKSSHFLIAIVCGLLLSCAFPGCNLSFLVWVALAPMAVILWSLTKVKIKRRAIFYGYTFGLTFFLINVSWLQTVSWLGVLVLAFYLAIYPALWALFAATWGNPLRGNYSGKSTRIFLFALMNAAIWAMLECLRGWVMTGFSWNGLGVALHENLLLVQSADVFGVAGLSGLIVFIQLFVTQLIFRKKGELLEIKGGIITLGLLMLAIVGYGAWRLNDLPKLVSSTIKVLLVQLNIPQDAARQLWSAEEIHMAYEDEVEKALIGAVEKPDLVVLPEVALNGRLFTTAKGMKALGQENITTIERIKSFGDFAILSGMMELESKEIEGNISVVENPRSWNSIVIIPANEDLKTYQKKHLVMFGEYIPFIEEIPLLRKIYEQQAGVSFTGSFAKGETTEPIALKLGDENLSIIPSICFEDTVARQARTFLRNEPQVIVNITNDGWFKESVAAKQHFANAKFRAIEMRRPMIRCSNTGVSAVVSATGSVTNDATGYRQVLEDKSGSHFTRGSLLADVTIPKEGIFSLYMMWGDWPIYISGLLSLCVGWILNKKTAVPFQVQEPRS
jgi:apolipoprotein N-acyltransferase